MWQGAAQPGLHGDSKQNFYWGYKEILVPIYKNMADAMATFPEVDNDQLRQSQVCLRLHP